MKLNETLNSEVCYDLHVARLALVGVSMLDRQRNREGMRTLQGLFNSKPGGASA